MTRTSTALATTPGANSSSNESTERYAPSAEPRSRALGSVVGSQGSSSTTSLELTDAAIALHNGLLHRALELTRNGSDAEDLLQDVYVVFVAKPPDPRGLTQLKRWLRTVMLRKHIDAQRRRRDQVPDVSLELLRGW